MSTMFPPVFATLKASQAVKDIVGTNPPRIFRHSDAPQDVTRPYVTWFIVSDVPENNLSDPPSGDRVTVQIDCWHPEDKGVELLATAVRDAMELVCHMTAVIVNYRDPETKLFRVGAQFDMWVFRGD